MRVLLSRGAVWRRLLPVVAATGVVSLAAGAASAATAESRVRVKEKGNIDLLLLLDTSASMAGKAGGTNIFPHVKETASALVDACRPGDNVVLMTYDTDVRPRPAVLVYGTEDLDRLKAEIRVLEAKGAKTWTAKAIHDAFAEARRLDDVQRGGPGGSHPKIVILLTDGINDPPAGVPDTISLAQAAARVKDLPVWVWQIQLGPQVDAALDSALRSKLGSRSAVLKTRADSLLDLVRPSIIEKQMTLARRHPLVTMQVEPATLDFGALAPGTAETLRVQVSVRRSEAPVPIRVSITGSAHGVNALADPPETMADTLAPTEDSLVLTAASRVRTGGREGTVTIEARDSLAVPHRLEVAWKATVPNRPFPWRPVGLGLGGIALMALLAGVVVGFRRRAELKLHGVLDHWPTAGGASGETPPGMTAAGRLTLDERRSAQHRVGTSEECATRLLAPAGQSFAFTVTAQRFDGEIFCVVTPEAKTRVVFEGVESDALQLHNGDAFDVGPYSFSYESRTVPRRPNDA